MRVGCVIWGCELASINRGLCPRHYRVAMCRVRAGETTWAKEVNAGRAKPAKRVPISIRPRGCP